MTELPRRGLMLAGAALLPAGHPARGAEPPHENPARGAEPPPHESPARGAEPPHENPARGAEPPPHESPARGAEPPHESPARGAEPPHDTLEIGAMTAPQLAAAVAAGWRTAILPSGGLEQNGPHMIIAKHDHIIRWAAREVARRLGHALVAPVISYVPEGGWDPPTGNMAWPGTIGVTPQVFAGILEGAARSLKRAGFRAICMLADNGASQQPQAEIAARLDRAWRREGVRVLGIGRYYAAAAAQDRQLLAEGVAREALGAHAGLADTAELMATHPAGVDLARLEGRRGAALERVGASGDPSLASAERGRALLQIRIDAAVEEIRAALR